MLRWEVAARRSARGIYVVNLGSSHVVSFTISIIWALLVTLSNAFNDASRPGVSEFNYLLFQEPTHVLLSNELINYSYYSVSVKFCTPAGDKLT